MAEGLALGTCSSAVAPLKGRAAPLLQWPVACCSLAPYDAKLDAVWVAGCSVVSRDYKTYRLGVPPCDLPGLPTCYQLLHRMLQTELLRVDIETASTLSAGQTVCDIWGQSRLPKNCTVCMVRERSR